MVAASYSTDLADIAGITQLSSTNSWNATGGGASGLNAETDYYILASNCISKNAWSNALKGMIYEGAGATVIAAGDALYVWATHATPNSLNTVANGGFRVSIGTGESARDEWAVAGADEIFFDIINWAMFVVDPTTTPDYSIGNAGATPSGFGATADMVGGPTKGAPFGIGGIRHGRVLTVVGGDLANGYATAIDIAAFDNDETRRWGQLIQVGATSLRLRGKLQLGSAATAVDMRDSGKVITVPPMTHVAAGFNEIEVVNAGSNVELQNFTFRGESTTAPGKWTATDNATVDLSGSLFESFAINGQNITFGSNTDASGCTFRQAGTVIQNGANLNGALFDRSTEAVAVEADTLALLAGATFVGDSNHGIRDTGAPGAKTLEITESGYNATTGDNPTANTGPTDAFYFNDTGGHVDLTVPNGDVSVRNGAGATTTTIVSAETVAITVVDKSGAPIQGARAYIHDLALTEILEATTDALGQVSTSYTGSTPLPIKGWVRDYDLTSDYETAIFSGSIQAGGGFQQTITMEIE